MTRDTSATALPWHRKALYGIANWALLVAGLANLTVGTWAALNNSAATAATSLTAGLVLLFAATIDRFESLKGLGIEAKTKQLDNKIVQADEALRRLREMTEITCEALVDLNSKMGRLGSAPGPRELFALADRVRTIMGALGSDAKAIDAVLYPWAKILCFDMAQAQTKKLQDLVKDRLSVLWAERERLQKSLNFDDPKLLDLGMRIKSLSEYQKSRLSGLQLLRLEDYPDRFMSLFDEVPQIEASEVEPLRTQAARFADGMRSLSMNRRLSDPELWISEIERARS